MLGEIIAKHRRVKELDENSRTFLTIGRDSGIDVKYEFTLRPRFLGHVGIGARRSGGAFLMPKGEDAQSKIIAALATRLQVHQSCIHIDNYNEAAARVVIESRISKPKGTLKELYSAVIKTSKRPESVQKAMDALTNPRRIGNEVVDHSATESKIVDGIKHSLEVTVGFTGALVTHTVQIPPQLLNSRHRSEAALRNHVTSILSKEGFQAPQVEVSKCKVGIFNVRFTHKVGVFEGIFAWRAAKAQKEINQALSGIRNFEVKLEGSN